MPAKQSGYTGKLAAPLVRPAPLTFTGAVTVERVQEFWRNYERHQRKVEQRVSRELSRRMSLLMKHYGIADKNDTKALALALALEHVPGFRIVPESKNRRGRKKEWHGEKLQALYDVVQSVKRQHNYNDRQALKFISNNSSSATNWGAPSKYKGSKMQWIETLESRLQDAKRYVGYIDSLSADFESIRTGVLREKFQKL